MTANQTDDESTERYEDGLDLSRVDEGDRIAPELIPHSPDIDVGESVNKHRLTGAGDDRTYDVRLIRRGTGSYGDVQTALIYDPAEDLFARIGGHTKSGAMNQKERDWKVRDVGRDVEVIAYRDVDINDDRGQSDEDFISEWVKFRFGEASRGHQADVIREFDGNEVLLKHPEGDRARVAYRLVGGDE